MKIPSRAEMTEITVYKRRLLGETKLSRNSQNCLHEGIGEQTRGTMSFEFNGASQTSSTTSRTERAEVEQWIQPERQRIAQECVASIIWGVGGMHRFWQEFAQLSRYQDAKTTEHVGRVQAECAAKTQEPMHKQTCSCLTTTTERLGSDDVRVLK